MSAKEHYISRSQLKSPPETRKALKLYLGNKVVKTDNIDEKAVTAEKLADNSVNGRNLQNGTIDKSKIMDGSIVGANIADNAITSNKLQDNSIDSEQIAPAAVTVDKLAPGAIDPTKIILSDIAIDTNSTTGDILAYYINDSDVEDVNMDENTGDLVFTLN